jgi:hypothetical protein
VQVIFDSYVTRRNSPTLSRQKIVAERIFPYELSATNIARSIIRFVEDYQTLLAAASRLIMQTGVNRGQLTGIGTVVALPMALAGLAVRRYLVRAPSLGAVSGGEGESVKFENTGGG